MSHLTQMAGLAVQNFVSAAAGAAVAVALIRGLIRRRSKTIGNFWVDLVRTTTRVLVPLSFVLALVLVSQGAVQNFHGTRTVHTVEGATQSIPGGPIAGQEAIKDLGQNGGGPYNANAAHPFENPNPITDLLIIWAILAIPFALTFTFGRMAKDQKQGWVVFAAMFVLWIVGALIAMPLEARGNPKLTAAGATQQTTAFQSGGNMEGKETRFGIAASSLFTAITTGASCGAVNTMHDSLTPLGGLVPMWLIQLGEVIFGGVGSGLYGMLAFAVVAVFIAGLMVGRTPEYIGKKIEAYEMKMASLAVLIPCALVVVCTAIAVMAPAGASAVGNPGMHGFSEILYAVSSASNNNGSAFGGLSANTPFWNVLLGVCMFLSRYTLAIAMLALAGSLAAKKHVPASAGTLPTHTPLFVTLLACVVIVVGALTFLPALALGPIAEYLMAAH
jgi:K+-transporting ATPase ATPase A chain